VIEWYQALLLALLQGLTEFLPISSSAHLVIPSLLLDWPDQGLAFDVAVHVGTGGSSEESTLVWYLALATVPAAIVGLVAGDLIEDHLRTLPVIATTTLLFGLLLGLAQRMGAAAGKGRALNLPLAMAIGLAQAMAPVPGVSRSGVTITAALMLGMDRQGAARFSFLLSIPIIASAGALKLWQLVNAKTAVDWWSLGMGVVVSAVTAYLCIALFLRMLDRVGLMPFVYYRIALAAVLYLLWVVPL
jgi:undecaprenyl-diphosphatase